MSIDDDILGRGVSVLEGFHGHEVTFRDSSYVATIDESAADRAQRRGPPDQNTRFGAIVEIRIDALPVPPKPNEYITDGTRKHRIKSVARVGLVWRMTCEPNL